MSILKVSPKVQAGLYNFADDATAGAIGTIALGVRIPAFAVITGFWVTELSAVTSGGAATISFGTITTNSSPVVSTVNNLMTATAIASFTAQPLIGVDLNAAPLRLLVPIQVTMSIAAFALTAGTLQFQVEYFENLR